MYPEDRVLVGVINRKRDLDAVRAERWYRIPQAQMPRGVNAEYMAFFLSRAFKEQNGTIAWFAEKRGLELVYRKDLLPREADHPRAQDVYYKVQLGELKEKTPPILNPTKRTISFIYTTWDRFVQARAIRDLYSDADYFVDRVYHALREVGVPAERTWSAEYRTASSEIRVLCQRGTFVASTEPGDGRQFFLNDAQPQDKILAKILADIASQGGPVMLPIPISRFQL